MNENASILLDRACDVSKFASKEPTRMAINTVHLHKDGVEATDGRLHIRVPYPSFPLDRWAHEKLPECKTPAIGSIFYADADDLGQLQNKSNL